MLDGISNFGSELRRTNDLLQKRVSYRRVFLLGIVQGVGTAIGATLFAGVAIALFLRFANFLDNPFINQYIENISVRVPVDYPTRNQ